MERRYKDVAAMNDFELSKALLDLRVERYMSEPDMAREMIREVLAREQGWDRAEMIDDLYNEGYWA